MTEKERWLQWGLGLEYATLAWNVVGTVVVLRAAWAARSVALAGFGLDSVIEIFASVVVVWQLRGRDEARQARALRLIGLAFFALALYLVVEIAITWAAQLHPAPSPAGIIWLAATSAAMLLLSYGKRHYGRRLENPVLVTEARVTAIDALLSVSVLAGLVLNAVAGWWWADLLSGLILVYYATKEGFATLNQPA